MKLIVLGVSSASRLKRRPIVAVRQHGMPITEVGVRRNVGAEWERGRGG